MSGKIKFTLLPNFEIPSQSCAVCKLLAFFDGADELETGNIHKFNNFLFH